MTNVQKEKNERKEKLKKKCYIKIKLCLPLENTILLS